MATKIETLKKPNGDQVLPRTRAKAVSMENGTTVEAAINDIHTTISELQVGTTPDFILERLQEKSDIGHTHTAEEIGAVSLGDVSWMKEYITTTMVDVIVDMMLSLHDVSYYSTMSGAVTDVNNGTVGENADATKKDAVAGVYVDGGEPYVVLLKDYTDITRIQPSVDMTINLGGHTLSTNDIVCIDALSGNITIDGRLNGSAVSVTTNTDGKPARPIQSYADNLIINGGTYIGNTTKAPSNGSVMYYEGAIQVKDAAIIANDTSGSLKAITAKANSTGTFVNCNITAISTNGEIATAVQAQENASIIISDCNINATSENGHSSGVLNEGLATISNCDITAISKNGKSHGISNHGTATVSDCNIRAYANYTYDDGENYYGAISMGVSNSSAMMTINNCYVIGAHSGLQNTGTLYVNGGTYEGYGHGGFYFAGTGTISYVCDATIRECKMPDGYIGTAGRNGAGFYIGGSDGNNNVYMNNCDIQGYSGTSQVFVLKDNNNTLYISNSRINEGTKIRIDTGNKLYIGAGNNFTAADTNNPDYVIETNDVYVMSA